MTASEGLTSLEARRRLAEAGPNSPPTARRRGLVARAGDQLRDPMILLLQAAAVLSAVLRDWPNTAIIAAVVVFNTTAGVVQQYRADRAMEELRNILTSREALYARAEARVNTSRKTVDQTLADVLMAIERQGFLRT